MGPIRLLETTEFEPTPEGTTIRWRWGTPKTAKERSLVRQMESYLYEAMTTSSALLAEHVEAELARHRMPDDDEPGPSRRPDGPLAGLPATS
jgi:hypothetical protein